MHDDQDDDTPSKSRLKREAEALQVLGRTITELPAIQFDEFMRRAALPDGLDDALRACRGLTDHGGRRRQLQYIGKLMRAVDAEPLRVTLDSVLQTDRAAVAELHRLERWRERLLQEGDPALTEWVRLHPATEVQHLRQLMMQARKEAPYEARARASRALFQYLKKTGADTDEE